AHPTSTPDIYTLSLHDALPISDLRNPLADRHQHDVHDPDAADQKRDGGNEADEDDQPAGHAVDDVQHFTQAPDAVSHVTSVVLRSEEHTSELQSRVDLVCRLLL